MTPRKRALKLWCAVGACFAITFGGVPLVLRCVGEPETSTTIQGRAETLAVEVRNPVTASLELTGVHVLPVASAADLFTDPDAGASLRCARGQLVPGLGARVRFRRGAGALTISVEDAGGSETPTRFVTDGGPHALGPGSLLVVDPGDPACRGVIPAAIPIWGPASLGDEGAVAGGSGQPGALISATVRIYARSNEIFGPSGFYLSDEIALPPGSRLVESNGDDEAARSAWIGALRVDDPESPGFDVNLSTAARALRVYRAGIKGSDTLQVSLFARQFRDPGVLHLQILFGILIVLLQLVTSFAALLTGADEPGTGESPSLAESSLSKADPAPVAVAALRGDQAEDAAPESTTESPELEPEPGLDASPETRDAG